MKTNVYIDGFNFYYGCVKKTPYKWLDFGALCRASFPNDTINHIRYFTADVISDASDPGKTARQLVYIRALETIPNLSVHKGRFFKTTKQGMLMKPHVQGMSQVTIKAWEEKASDVSIATHLVADGFRGDYEQAIVISNDSDLIEPIILVRRELDFPVGVLSPHSSTGKPSYHLQKEASFYRPVDRSFLGACQFPATLLDARGRTITKPPTW